ncbi:MAG TPA: PAS domain S-box protein [Roseiflexaceae bacterium]|nr:PAS domain S-box protein [Roseiflexaceae bacterium]HMP41511.1 PAS domain S-box protein [Roseiflexaceae bacterium]
MADRKTLQAENSALRARIALLEARIANQAQQEQAAQQAGPAARRSGTSELQQLPDWYRLLFERSLNAILIADDSGTYLDANEAAARLIGIPRQQLIGLNVRALRTPRDEDLQQRFRRYIDTGPEQGEFIFYQPDGDLRIATYTANRIGDNLHMSILQDVTDLRQIEEDFHEINQRYRLITENAIDLIELLDIDADAVCIYASPSHQAVFGIPPDQIVGMRLFDAIHQHDLAIVEAMWQNLIEHGTGNTMARVRHLDGSWRWIEATIRSTEHHGRRLALLVGRDVTERKHMEQRYLQAQKMESVGRLAGGVAHDFNNLLTAIQGYTSFAIDAIGIQHPAQSDLAEIQHTIKRASWLTQQLLAFSRRQPVSPQTLNLNERMLDTTRLLRRLIGEDIELIVLPDPELALTRVDPGQLDQVLVNLVVNARDAMPQGGTLTIETSNVVLDHEYARRHDDVEAGAYVMLSVSDTGAGMAPEVMRHLFEPFFTTKEPGRGTGLGLATCYGIITQHGGHIWCYSTPDAGTTFRIYLPQVSAEIEQQPLSHEPLINLLHGHETILVVEDEPAVLSLIARILLRQGYHVLTAVSGAEALQLMSGEHPPIQLVITDLIMPQISGIELARTLRHQLAQLRVIYMSGHTDHSAVGFSRHDSGVLFLQKPFSAQELARVVRIALDQPPGDVI